MPYPMLCHMFQWCYHNHYGHVMSKSCQYAVNDVYVCNPIREVLINDAQISLQRIITWTKKKWKRKAWMGKACKDATFCFQKLKAKHEHQFPNIGFLASQMMGIMGLQIETINFFSTFEIINCLRHCFLVARI